jgi:hypothetical protein
MKIEIAKKYIPYSQVSGASCIIPNTTLLLTAYPKKLVIEDIKTNSQKNKKIEFDWDIKEFFTKFFVFQDLEKDRVVIQAITNKNKFYRFIVLASMDHVSLFLENMPKEIPFEVNANFKTSLTNGTLHRKDELEIKFLGYVFLQNANIEKLSLGSHKKQDMELIDRRSSLIEILPLVYLLAQKIPNISEKSYLKTHLLKEIEKKNIKDQKDEIEDLFLCFYKTYFSSILTPNDGDYSHQFFKNMADLKLGVTRAVILKKAYEVIRHLFFKESKNEISLLPCLLTSFHQGRLINIDSTIGLIDILWSKKSLKMMTVRSTKTKKIKFNLQSHIKTFRIRKTKKEKGIVYKVDDLIKIEKDQIYLFDRFFK